jgi:hypothetical protein
MNLKEKKNFFTIILNSGTYGISIDSKKKENSKNEQISTVLN